jgi:hypothetical protein
MAYTDDQLLDFDKSRMTYWDENRARSLLAGPHADLYRNHLAIGKWIDGWLAVKSSPPLGDKAFMDGYERGVREVAADLRNGELLPGGLAFP